MQGYITELDFDVVERFFPGIRRFFYESTPRPVTFLELLWRFQDSCSSGLEASLAGDSAGHRKPA